MIKTTYIDHMGSDLSVVNAARVSFGKQSDWVPRVHNGEARVLSQRDTKLINYLGSHEHISPFGHCFATFHVKAPVFVARQLVKHKFLRWNEISRRYVDDEPEFYTPKVWRKRSTDKKQGSSGPISLFRQSSLDHEVTDDYEVALNVYRYMLNHGVCPEQARMVLPQSMMTEWYWSGSLDAFADMCNLRCKPDTQLESQMVANQIDTIMADLYPVSWKSLRGE